MPRPRLPDAKAEASGAKLINPGRFADRKAPKVARPLGLPYVKMTDAEKEQWFDFDANIPWLNSSHRQIVRAASILAAKMDAGEITVPGIQALSAILSKLGATPADETKIKYDPGEEQDDFDRLLDRPN